MVLLLLLQQQRRKEKREGAKGKLARGRGEHVSFFFFFFPFSSSGLFHPPFPRADPVEARCASVYSVTGRTSRPARLECQCPRRSAALQGRKKKARDLAENRFSVRRPSSVRERASASSASAPVRRCRRLAKTPPRAALCRRRQSQSALILVLTGILTGSLLYLDWIFTAAKEAVSRLVLPPCHLSRQRMATGSA